MNTKLKLIVQSRNALERLNLWIIMLFGRVLGSVNRTDFMQHMLRKKFGSTYKIQAWKLNLAKRGKKLLKIFWSFRRKSMLKLVQNIEKGLYELSDCCFSKCQHGNPNKERWIGSWKGCLGTLSIKFVTWLMTVKNCQVHDDEIFPGIKSCFKTYKQG